MFQRVVLITIAVSAMFTAACSDPYRESDWTQVDPSFSDRFKIIAVGDVPVDRLSELSATFFEGVSTVLEHFDHPELPSVTIKVYGDREVFEEAYGENAQMVGGFISAEDWEVHIYNWSGNAAMERTLGGMAVHEYTHLVSLAVNPTISHNPRWLWETVAIYESNRPTAPAPESLTCISQTAAPSLADLETHTLNIYRLGYLLGDYIATTWGRHALLKLVESNGDIEASLGVPEEAFEAGWPRFIASRYETQDPSVPITPDC